MATAAEMMRRRHRRIADVLLLVLALAHVVAVTSAAHILDIIYRDVAAVKESIADEAHITEPPSPDVDVEPESSCQCVGSECKCCVDFNITFIDLGGPGCVKLKYISQQDGVLMNVSYGDSLLRSALTNGANPSPTCVSMLGQLAAVCARFTHLVPHANGGLQGCLKLEPHLLGDVQTQFNIGCFTMDDMHGMRMDDSVLPPPPEEEEEGEEAEVTTLEPLASTNQTASAIDNLNEEDIIAAVNESAQKGLAFFQNWLGIDLAGAAAAIVGATNATALDEKDNAPAT